MTISYDVFILVSRIIVFVCGFCLVCATLFSAIRSFVLPRGAPDAITAIAFRCIRILFALPLTFARTYSARDRIMALYAPISLFILPPIWLTLVLLGYMGMFWAFDLSPLRDLFLLSGSSLLTLGFASVETLPQMILAFSEATVGLLLIALLIAYLPAIYGNFSRRETAVARLSVRAGTPPSASEMIQRVHRIGELDYLRAFWEEWERVFAEIEESHTSIAALVFFRSQSPEHSWVTATGTVLDTAGLILAAVDTPNEPQAALCLRSGYLALQRIASYFKIPHNSDPHYPDEPISITREEFEAVLVELQENDVPVKTDWDQAWQDFAGWRVNYDTVLLALASLTMAPYAKWSSDRSQAPNKARRKYLVR
ncbi:hypothetical protein KFU94_18460 [Chloroflexi bacterium TSY]|nr:hypothetical protein [Chloroflexi bacterium TSY]